MHGSLNLEEVTGLHTIHDNEKQPFHPYIPMGLAGIIQGINPGPSRTLTTFSRVTVFMSRT